MFHSEADFQHELAWRIREENPNRKIRLEYPFGENDDRKYLDILVMEGDKSHAIELKYKTARLEANIKGECFSLAIHGAQPVNRHAVAKDIKRMEEFVCADKSKHTASILFLTNDDAYWKMPNNWNWKNTMDADFRLHEGNILEGKPDWTGETHVDPTEIILKYKYKMHWRDYSEINSENGTFRYLCIDVQGKSQLMRFKDFCNRQSAF